MDAAPRMDSQRADKWMWVVRIAKTRALAAKMIAAGHVRVNRRKISRASAPVRIGDVLTIAHRGFVGVFEVTGFSSVRVSAKQARELKVDLTEKPPSADPDRPTPAP